MAYVIGVDVGGTFTDAVLDDDSGSVIAAKAPSTPPDYSQGVLDVLELLAEQLGRPVEEMLADTHHVAHGTTSSLNALVQRQVPDVGFLTTKGHRDSIFIMNVEGRYLGRSPHELQHVLAQDKDHDLLPKRHALEVTERIDRDGNVIVALDEDEVRRQVQTLKNDGIEAIAVSLLWAFRNPTHEKRIRELVHEIDPDIYVALSSEVSPRIREFARNSTTIMSTQVGPGLRRYLTNLEDSLPQQGPRRPAAGDAVQRRSGRRDRGPTTGDLHRRLRPDRRRRRVDPARQEAGPPEHHLHRRRRHDVPRRADRRRRARARHHDRHQPPPDQRPDAAGARHRLRRRRDRVGRRRRQPADRPAERARRPRAGRVRPGRHRADQHRRQPRPRHPPDDGSARRPQGPRPRARAGRHQDEDRRAARACPPRTPRPPSTPPRTRRPATCCARPSSRPATTPATSSSTPSAAPARRSAPPTRASSGSTTSSSRSGRSPPRSPPTASPPPTSRWRQELSDPAQLPVDPVRAEKNFAQLEDQVRQGSTGRA